jgi:hypothetical protein
LLDLRAPLIPLAALAGLALGALAWLAAGRQDTLALLEAQLTAVSPARGSDLGAIAPPLSGPPLFALSTGPGAVKDPAVSVLGLSRMPGRSAALVSIDGKPAAWLVLGETREGVILRAVESGRALLDLPLGVRTLRIGESVGTPAAGSASTVPFTSNATTSDTPPPGFRSPPPPASAPGFIG